MKTYKVNEIFCSLQGEGYYTGTPAVFLRLSGCNLNCEFCDTQHIEGRQMNIFEIMEAVAVYPPRHIVITGGEPSLQLDHTLIDALHGQGWFIQVETNGTHPLPDTVDWVTCSPKGDAPVVLPKVDELKIVYLGQDVESIADTIPADNLFLQPCDTSGKKADKEIAAPSTEKIIDYIVTHPWWRLSLQTHKLLAIR